MKLTKKKKALILSAALRDTQILGVAVLQYRTIFSELKPFVRDTLGEDATKSLFDALAKINHVNNTLNDIYSKDKSAKLYLKNADGLTHIEEMSTRVIEKMNEITETYQRNLL